MKQHILDLNRSLYLTLLLAVTVEPSFAANECGIDAAGQDTIICNQKNHANGVTYVNSDGLTLILNNSAMTIGGTPGVSVTSSATSTGDITVNGDNFNTLTTAGNGNHGIEAIVANANGTQSATATLTSGTIIVESTTTRTIGLLAETYGLGAVLARMDGGTISSTGSVAVGITTRQYNSSNTGTNTILITDGMITTSGNGLDADILGQGLTLVQMDGGLIETTGDFGRGIIINKQNTISTTSSIGRITGGEISTVGSSSYGVLVANSDNGIALGEMSGGTITTSGTSAVGIFIYKGNTNSNATAASTLSGGEIITAGQGGHGIQVSHLGLGDVDVSATGGMVTASGLNAHGIYADSRGSGIDVTVSTEITGGSGAGYAVSTETSAGQNSTIAINASADISSAAGLAIFNNQGDSQSNIAVGAQVAGEINLGNGSDTLDIGGDASNITVLNGGDDVGAGDGWIDVLTLRNQNIADLQNAPTLINWEEVNIIDSTFAADGTTAGTVNVTNSSVTLGGTSAVNDLLGSTEDQTITVTDDMAIANTLEGAGGADSLSVLGNTSVIGGLFGGGEGQDASALADAADTITVNTTGTVQVVEGGAGGDVINLLGGTITTDVLGQADNDIITLNGAMVTGNIDGGTGDDSIDLLAGAVSEVLGGDDNDTIMLNGATVGGNIDGGAGNDTIDLLSGTVSNVLGLADDDAITLNGATVTGNIVSGTGNDNFIWQLGSTTDFRGGDGSDVADIRAAEYDGTQILDGGDDADSGDGWIDQLTLGNQVIAGTISGANILNWENVFLVDSTLEVDDLVTETLNVSGGSTTLGGASAITSVLGSISDETITVTDVTVITNVLEGAGGVDSLSVLGNASVTGGVFGGGAGQDASALADGADLITINTTGTVQMVDGGAGDDVIDLLGGTITTDVLGQADDDTITLNGATVDGDIDGGAGEDTIDLLSGTVNTAVLGQGDDDTITLNGATVTGNIDGGTGEDTIDLLAGTADFDVLGQDAVDTITLDGATVTGSIDGGAGVDGIDLLSGTVNTNVLGGNDNDTITLNGATVTGNIDGGTGGDTIDLLAGAISEILGGDDNDTITLNGTTVTGNIDGGAGADVIDLVSGTVNTDVLGGTGNDTFLLNGANIDGSIDAGAGEDRLTWRSGSMVQFNGGEGADVVEITAAEYDNTQILDGGDNDDEANGIVDELYFYGLDVEIAGSINLINWEIIFLDDTKVDFVDNYLSTSKADGSGLFLTNDTTLKGGDEFIYDGNMSILGTSEFEGSGGGQGVYQVENLSNNGRVNLQDGATGDTMTVLSDYSGAGALLLDVDLVNNSADTLVIDGDVTGGGITEITVEDLAAPASASTRAMTFSNQSILLVDVTGATAAGDFTLVGETLTKGAFDYILELESSQWMLVLALNSMGAVAGAAPSVLINAFTDLPTLEQRTVSRQWLWTGAVSEDGQSPDQGVWLRFSGDHVSASAESNAGVFDYDSDVWGTQAGMEFRLSDNEYGQWLLGVTLQHGTVDADVGNAQGRGSVEADGYGAGLTATWVGHSGSYLDLQGQINWIESDFSTRSAGTLIEAHSFTAHAISIEAGRRFAIKGNHSLIPQAQLSLGQIDGDRFTASSGTEIDPGANDSLTARLGLAYNYNLPDSEGRSLGNVYLVGNVLPTLSGISKVRVGDTEIRTEYEPTWGEIGIGGSIAVRENARLYAEGSYKTALFDTVEDSEGYSFSVGMNINWL